MPSESDSASEGGVAGTLGYIQLELDYKKRLNLYFSGSISLDIFKYSDESSTANEVDELPLGVAYDADDASYGAIFLSGGATYNTNAFDNFIFFAGPAISFGNTVVQDLGGRYFKVDDTRFGLMGGVVFAFDSLFVALDYTTNINSGAISIGYGF